MEKGCRRPYKQQATASSPNVMNPLIGIYIALKKNPDRYIMEA